MFLLILTLCFALLVAIFAIQNAVPVVIHLFWMTTQVPLVLVILGSVFAGAIIVFLIAIWREFRLRRIRSTEASKDKGFATPKIPETALKEKNIE